jgi:hypothetical protein
MFNPIPASLIQVGKALKKEIFDLIKGNFDDINSRLSVLEAGGARVIVLNNDVILSSSATTFTGLAYFKAPQNFSLNNCEIQIFEKGSIATGTLEIDIKKNSTPDNAGMASVFTTQPSINFASASDYGVSTNQVFDSTISQVDAGDILRFDITSLPVGLGKFRILLFGEV